MCMGGGWRRPEDNRPRPVWAGPCSAEAGPRGAEARNSARAHALALATLHRLCRALAEHARGVALRLADALDLDGDGLDGLLEVAKLTRDLRQRGRLRGSAVHAARPGAGDRKPDDTEQDGREEGVGHLHRLRRYLVAGVPHARAGDGAASWENEALTPRRERRRLRRLLGGPLGDVLRHGADLIGPHLAAQSVTHVALHLRPHLAPDLLAELL